MTAKPKPNWYKTGAFWRVSTRSHRSQKCFRCNRHSRHFKAADEVQMFLACDDSRYAYHIYLCPDCREDLTWKKEIK